MKNILNIFLLLKIIYFLFFLSYYFSFVFPFENKNINYHNYFFLIFLNIIYFIAFGFYCFLFFFSFLKTFLNKNKLIKIYKLSLILLFTNLIFFPFILILNYEVGIILNNNNFYNYIFFLNKLEKIYQYYFSFFLIVIWLLSIYIRKKYFVKEIYILINLQKNKLNLFFKFIKKFFKKSVFIKKIILKIIFSLFITKRFNFNTVILITNITKKIRLIEFKRGHFPYLF